MLRSLENLVRRGGMQVSVRLEPAAAQRARELVRSGAYKTVTEAVNAALEQLPGRARSRSRKHDELG